MLEISKISDIEPYSNQWFENRLGKMTSSLISCLCTPKGIGKGGLTYIRNKVFETLTGKSTEKNITSEAILWGVENEPKSIAYWKSITPSCHRLLTNQHIVYNERFSSTPDALVMMNKDCVFVTKDGIEYLNCETLETKSYMTPSIHMAHVQCKTATDIRELNIDLFYQVVSQIYWAGVTRGRCIFFHPDFPEGSPYRMGEVIFKRTELMAEFKFFQQRMDEAVNIFQRELNWTPVNQ